MISLLIFFLLIAPLTILFHEFGHAGMAYILKADLVHFFIGSGRERAALRVGRIHLHLHTLLFMGGQSLSEKENDFKAWEKVLISIAGPIMNGVVAWGISFMSYENTVIQLAIWFNLWLAILNLIPFRHGRKKSDGYVCVEVFIKSLRTRD
ncbi:hypothetical protein GCM10008986_02690 [Salinibacillus aidingensis]|uniref:Peptidase M50 domain-containing protein n=1 Tax=Salinibacillus aidingensis TaxID=237684 RepID=A0ABP3KK05_9BACI